jgi:hypothetical protein
MRKDTWYLICDREEMVAVNCLQLPNEWRDIPDMWEKSDEELARIYEVSPTAEQYTILTIDAARSAGIQVDSIDEMLMASYDAAKAWVRTMRDPVLLATDMVTGTDRWPSLDVVARRNITNFRQVLRDITRSNVYNLKWPEIPQELDFIRELINPMDIANVDVGFCNMLFTRSAPLTVEQITADQWLRIHEEREIRKAGGVRILIGDQPYWFWTDEPSRNQYALLCGFIDRNGIGLDQVFENWKTMSKEFVPLTPRLLYNVIDSGVVAEKILFKIAEDHNTAMKASDDPANYDFKSGWPPTFQEALTKGTL